MTVDDRQKEGAQLQREARRQIEHLLSGEASPEDFEKARIWREQTPAHAAAFAEAKRLWQDFGVAGRALLAHEGPPVWIPPPPALSRRAILAGGAGAVAAGVAYTVVHPPLGLWPSLEVLRADYRTATGEQKRLTLANQVTVQMNTQTSIDLATSNGDLDQVKLVAGQASFTLPADQTRPFAVVAEGGRTIASRARFDVYNSGANVCVTCFEGDVQVEQGSRRTTVAPGGQLRYSNKVFGDVASVNLEEASAWRDGVLVFRQTPLSDVITELNRYRPGRIILIKEAIAQKSVNGRFKIERIDEILGWIAEVYGATPRSLPGGIVLLG